MPVNWEYMPVIGGICLLLLLEWCMPVTIIRGGVCLLLLLEGVYACYYY